MNESALPEMLGRKMKILFPQSTWIPSSLHVYFDRQGVAEQMGLKPK
jgi:hypothetical protein